MSSCNNDCWYAVATCTHVQYLYNICTCRCTWSCLAQLNHATCHMISSISSPLSHQRVELLSTVHNHCCIMLFMCIEASVYPVLPCPLTPELQVAPGSVQTAIVRLVAARQARRHSRTRWPCACHCSRRWRRKASPGRFSSQWTARRCLNTSRS